jgi:DNA-binding XRE family transcriptional regulator
MDDFKISMAAARVNANKTQAEVAEALHVGKQTVVSWENGKTSPTVEKAQEFCQFCNIPFDRVSFLRERNAI